MLIFAAFCRIKFAAANFTPTKLPLAAANVTCIATIYGSALKAKFMKAFRRETSSKHILAFQTASYIVMWWNWKSLYPQIICPRQDLSSGEMLLYMWKTWRLAHQSVYILKSKPWQLDGQWSRNLFISCKLWPIYHWKTAQRNGFMQKLRWW